MNPRPVNSISLDNKPVSVNTSFETINTEKDYKNNNHHSGGWNSYVKSIDNESDIFLSSRKNQNDCPYQLLNPNQEAQEKSKQNIDNIKTRIRILMKSNTDLQDIMSKEIDNVKSFYSTDRLIERLTENMDPVKFA